MEAAGGESDGSSGCRINRTDSFLRRITSRSSRSFQQLLVMEAVGGVSVFKRNNGRNDDDDDGDDDDLSLPGYERLPQSMRSPEDSDPIDRNKQKQLKLKPKQVQVQKQVQKLMQYVFARRGGVEGDDDNVKAVAKTEEEEEERRRKEEKKKKRSSWLPDPEKRWPIQGWG